MVHVWQCSTHTILLVASCSCPLKHYPIFVECYLFRLLILQCIYIYVYVSSLCCSVLSLFKIHSWFFFFCPSIALYVCLLDAQQLTAALVAVVNLDLSLRVSSTEAVEELLFIPTLTQLTLNVVSDHCALSILLMIM